MEAAEQVGGRVPFRRQRLDVLPRLLLAPSELIVLVEEHFESVRMLRQLLETDSAKEGAGVGAVVQPVLLLPAAEPGRSLGDHLQHRRCDVVGNAPSNVGELRRLVAVDRESYGGLASVDAFEAEGICLDPVDGAVVDDPTCYSTEGTRTGIDSRRARSDRVGVIAEVRQVRHDTQPALAGRRAAHASLLVPLGSVTEPALWDTPAVDDAGERLPRARSFT